MHFDYLKLLNFTHLIGCCYAHIVWCHRQPYDSGSWWRCSCGGAHISQSQNNATVAQCVFWPAHSDTATYGHTNPEVHSVADRSQNEIRSLTFCRNSLSAASKTNALFCRATEWPCPPDLGSKTTRGTSSGFWSTFWSDSYFCSCLRKYLLLNFESDTQIWWAKIKRKRSILISIISLSRC